MKFYEEAFKKLEASEKGLEYNKRTKYKLENISHAERLIQIKISENIKCSFHISKLRHNCGVCFISELKIESNNIGWWVAEPLSGGVISKEEMDMISGYIWWMIHKYIPEKSVLFFTDVTPRRGLNYYRLCHFGEALGIPMSEAHMNLNSDNEIVSFWGDMKNNKSNGTYKIVQQLSEVAAEKCLGLFNV